MTPLPGPHPNSTRRRRLHVVGFIDSASVFRISVAVRNLWIGAWSTVCFAAISVTAIVVSSSLVSRMRSQRQEIRDLRWAIVTERLRGDPFEKVDETFPTQTAAGLHTQDSDAVAGTAEESASGNPAEPILPEQLLGKQRRGRREEPASIASGPAVAPAPASTNLPTQSPVAQLADPLPSAGDPARAAIAFAFAASDAAAPVPAPGESGPMVGIEALQAFAKGEKQLELNFSLVNPDQASGVSVSGKVCVLALNASGAPLASYPRGLGADTLAGGSCNRGVPVKFARFRPTSVTLSQPGASIAEVAVIFTDSRVGASIVRRFQKKNTQ